MLVGSAFQRASFLKQRHVFVCIIMVIKFVFAEQLNKLISLILI